MSKLATAKASAREATQPNIALAQSEAETQRQLRQTLEHLALSMASVTTELTETMTSHRDLLSESTQRAQTVLAQGISEVRKISEELAKASKASTAQGITSLQKGISEVRTISEELAKTSKASAAQTSEQVKRLRMMVLAMTFAAGLMAGVILLISLLILRPQTIQTFWTVAHALRN